MLPASRSFAIPDLQQRRSDVLGESPCTNFFFLVAVPIIAK